VSTDPYRAFRPRRGAIVARVTAVVTVAAFVALSFAIPGEGPFGWGLVDRVLLVLFGLAAGGFIWRYSRLRAVPSPTGLRVVNLVHSHDLEWPQILGVGFSGGAPWAVLELTDTEEVSVMAIQRADGAFGRAEAARLAALIEHHSRADADD
jgi:hypothetical protein